MWYVCWYPKWVKLVSWYLLPCKVLPLHFFSTQRWGLRALFFIFLAALCGMWDLPPNQGLNPCPLYCECAVLTTGLPGKSLRVLFKIQIRSCQLKSARTSPCIRDEFFTSPNPGNSSFTSLLWTSFFPAKHKYFVPASGPLNLLSTPLGLPSSCSLDGVLDCL